MTQKKSHRISTALWVGAMLFWAGSFAEAASTEELLQTIKNVDRQGQGNVAAARRCAN